MKAILVHYIAGTVENGIYLDVTERGNDLAIRAKIYSGEWIIKANEIIDYIPLTVCGKSYEERKADLQNKAIEWHHTGSVANWSYGELASIQEFFERNGKRYGLLREFRENAII